MEKGAKDPPGFTYERLRDYSLVEKQVVGPVIPRNRGLSSQGSERRSSTILCNLGEAKLWRSRAHSQRYQLNKLIFAWSRMLPIILLGTLLHLSSVTILHPPGDMTRRATYTGGESSTSDVDSR